MTVPFDFEREAMRASGLSDEEMIKGCIIELDSMAGQFLSECGMRIKTLEKTRLLFHWLWRDRPSRYRPGGNFRLHQVIKAQADPNAPSVGNCLGLTLLFHCLLMRIGVTPGAIYLEDAFDHGPHILTHIKLGKSGFDCENIFPDGFDCKTYLYDPLRTIWGDKEVVGEIYHSAGNELFEKGDFKGTLHNYSLALGLNPLHERVKLNMTILMDRMGITNQ